MVYVYVPQSVLELYRGVPPESFVSDVPLDLMGYEDNEVVPFSQPILAVDGVPSKWVRYSDYHSFVDKLDTYWMEGEEFPLKVCIMPYTPLRDASYLHEMIQGAHSVDQQLPPDQPPPEMKIGLIDIGHGIMVKFTVMNYGLLWAKARSYTVLTRATDALQGCQQGLNDWSYKIPAVPQGLNAQLSSELHAARWQLVISLFEGYASLDVADADLHNAILGLFPPTHDQVYPELCHHCHPHLYAADHQDDHTTCANLHVAMLAFRNQELNIQNPLTIPMAEQKLVKAEAAQEFETCCSKFVRTRRLITNAISPTIDYVRDATTNYSLMGVSVPSEIANAGEAGNMDEPGHGDEPM